MNTLSSQLEQIAGHPRTLESDQFVYHQGDGVNAIYLILSGGIRLDRLTYGGDELTIAHVGAGECFGEAEVLLGLEARECFAMTTTPTTILPIFLRALTKEILSELRQGAIDRIFRTQLCLADMIPQSPTRRIAVLLRHLSSNGPIIRLSQDELGRSTGCPRETVSRALSQLKKAGAVEVERCAITILDPARLEA